jgi:large subunit ribosomal protein L22
MPVQAIAKGVRQSPRKVAVVADLVRGRSVNDALIILEHTPRRSAMAVKKVIQSASANADYNHGYKPATLRIVEISVTPGPRTKRYRPASRGLAMPYQKKSSHIKVIVDGELRPAKKSNQPLKTKNETEKTLPSESVTKAAIKNKEKA